MKRVLDASALLTGRQFPGELLTVPGVLDEVRRHGMSAPLEAILETQVRALSPGPEALDRVRAASEGTGDAHRLSPTDVELLALALDAQATVVTDDYSIQNVALALGVPYETVIEQGITDLWRWTYRCTGCGKDWPAWHEACPTCGSPLKTSRPRLTRGTR
ncbi:MAG TPA: nucleic acid-binding protein [Thermoplasmata archaeon]|nr:nucleic acid-binding protein [Thermoplasmata archaeon]